MNAFAETKTPPPQTRSVICPFCSTSMNPSYQLNGYDVVKCSDCGSFTVEPMPSERELGQYYQGFLFQADPGNLDRLRTKAMERWLRRYSRGPDCRMLDIGGGGGFFSRVFQDFGLGSATYLDIDTAACSFARLQLGLEEVLNIPLEEFQRREDTPRFDFIYCRHVLEHLADPLKLARDACALLKPGGALVLQCPNATSVEGILQPTRWRHYRRILADSNRRSSMWAQWQMMSGKAGWGLDPIRHLWALSPHAFHTWASRQNVYRVKVTSASLFHKVYSPYALGNSPVAKLKGALAPMLFGPLLQGAHLVVEIRLQSSL